MKKFHIIGMKTVKTALCVLICLLIYELFSFLGNLFEGGFVYNFLKISVLDGSPSFACIAAVICLQDSMKRTKQVALSRIIGSVLGGSFGLLFIILNNRVLSGKIYIIFAVIGTVVIISICNFLKNPISVSISVITFLIIFVGTDVTAPLYFSVNRVVGTLIGAATALIINKTIDEPKEE